MDKAAFVALIKEHHPAIAGQCKRVHAYCGAGACEVSDLVQVAHMRLWQKRDHLDVMKHPNAYIAQVSRNAALNEIKRLRRFVGDPTDLQCLTTIAART